MFNFWEKLKKPIYALAPMAGVTDAAFRQVSKSFGADVVYSEMASATALSFAPAKTLELLGFSEGERPYVVQLFGSKPDHFARAARLIAETGLPSANNGIIRSSQDDRVTPDGIDINFGCPVKKVARQGAGAVLMDKPRRAREIVKAVIGSTDLPVSLKVRSQVGQTDALKFLDSVSDLKLAAVMIHGRTMAQGFSGEADAAIIKKARDHFGGIILANGGVTDYETAIKLLISTGADGLGIARGAIGRPWIFKAARTGQDVARSRPAAVRVALRHAELAWALKGERGLTEMRRTLCAYVQGLPGAARLRERLVRAAGLEEIRKILTSP